MKTIPAVRTVHRAVPAVVLRPHPAEAVAVPDRVPQVGAVPVVPVLPAVLQVLLTDRICPEAVEFSDFREGNWCCTRSEVVRMTEMMTHPMTILPRMMIPQVPTVPAVAVLHPRPAAAPVVVPPAVAAVLRAAVVPQAVAAVLQAAALQVLHPLRNRVPRTMILRVPVIPAMMTAMN